MHTKEVLPATPLRLGTLGRRRFDPCPVMIILPAMAERDGLGVAKIKAAGHFMCSAATLFSKFDFYLASMSPALTSVA